MVRQYNWSVFAGGENRSEPAQKQGPTTTDTVPCE